MMPFEELTEGQRAYRLEEALKLSEEARKNLYGIGMQKERTVHSVLKFDLGAGFGTARDSDRLFYCGYLSPGPSGGSGDSDRELWKPPQETGRLFTGDARNGNLSDPMA